MHRVALVSITAGLLYASLSVSAKAALAQTLRTETPNVESPGRARWYGAPILLSDGIALATVGMTVVSTEGTGTLVGGAVAGLVYLAGGPLVHASKREYESLAASLGLRLLPLAVGGPIAYFNVNDRDMRGLTIGGFIMGGGAVAAMAVDIAGLAWKPAANPGAFATVVPARTAEGSPLLSVVGAF